MSKRIRKPEASGVNYADRLKKYFGFHLEGLDITNECGQIQVQLVYLDFKHIDTVRRELAQMMPEVEFIKIKRMFTFSAQKWILGRMMDEPERYHEPKIYVEREGGHLMWESLTEIANTELNQLELEEDDNIPYDETERREWDDDTLMTNSQY